MKTYLEPTQEAGRDLFMRNIVGPVVMLNLLRFRAVADYSAAPDLRPDAPISGGAAFDRYIDFTLPFLRKSGGELLLLAHGGPFLIGPAEARWDKAMLVRQASVRAFMAFANDRKYLVGLAHRTAALEDSRLLPLVEQSLPGLTARGRSESRLNWRAGAGAEFGQNARRLRRTISSAPKAYRDSGRRVRPAEGS